MISFCYGSMGKKIKRIAINRDHPSITSKYSKERIDLLDAEISKTKTKFSIFHKASRRDDSPIVLPKIFINNQVIKRQSSMMSSLF